MTINIKLAREVLGLSQEALANRMGLDQSTISLWESGRTPKTPSIFFIESLLKEAGFDPAEFRLSPELQSKNTQAAE